MAKNILHTGFVFFRPSDLACFFLVSKIMLGQISKKILFGKTWAGIHKMIESSAEILN